MDWYLNFFHLSWRLEKDLLRISWRNNLFWLIRDYKIYRRAIVDDTTLPKSSECCSWRCDAMLNWLFINC